MMDVTQLIPEFKSINLRAFIGDYNLGALVYKSYFPTEYTPELRWESINANMSAYVAADVVAFDSRSPRKGRQLPYKATGDIPKIEIARSKNETDLNRYRILQSNINSANNAAASAAKRRLFDWIYEDTTFVLNGINARNEWLAKQAASNGGFTLTPANNAGGVVTPVKVDFGIPNSNKTNVSYDWWGGTAANIKPITDIKTVDAAARAAGYRLGYMWTNKATFDKMSATDEVQKFVASYTTVALGLQGFIVPTLDAFNAAMRTAGLPQLIIWDSYVQLEGKNGALTTEEGWVLGNVTFTEGPSLGTTQWTTSADAFVTGDASTKESFDIGIVKVWAEQDPITMITKATSYSLPVIGNSLRTWILKGKLS